MENQLRQLAEYVNQSIHKGDFLLSVNRFSNFWIYLINLNQKPVRDLVQQIFEKFFANFLVENAGPFVVFATEFTETSEKEFPTGSVAERALRKLHSDRLNFEKVLVDQANGRITLNSHAFAGKTAIGMFALSIHVDLMRSVIDEIRNQGGEVSTIVTLCERENVSRGTLNSLQVDLIPLILFDAEKWEISHILAKTSDPFVRYHHYFHSSDL